jgi:2-oxoglutarate ferredoxin oxidoreductase subunit gamma
MSRTEIRYAAVGGQGIVTAGTLLMAIAVEKENLHAVGSPTTTSAVRGGATKVDVIISADKILFPQAKAIDFFLCTYQKSYDQYRDRIKPDAVVVLDTNLITKVGDTGSWKLHKIPIIQETKSRLGNVMLTSVVTLAITQELTGVVGYDNLVDYIREWAPDGLRDLNLKAVEVGCRLARKGGTK